jgi:hypothetical protein
MYWQYKNDVQGTIISNSVTPLMGLYKPSNNTSTSSSQSNSTTNSSSNTTTPTNTTVPAASTSQANTTNNSNSTAINSTNSTISTANSSNTAPSNTTTTNTSNTTTTPTSSTTSTTNSSSVVTNPSRKVNYPVRLVYIDSIAQWYGDAIATGLGVPGFAAPHIYNHMVFAFWLTSGPCDVAMIWSNPLLYFGGQSQFGSTNQQIQLALKQRFNNAGIKILVSAFGST